MAGVSDVRYAEPVKVDANLTIDALKDRLDFLKTVHENEFQDLKNVWGLVPEDTWTMYKLLGFKQLEEQKLLRQKQKALRKAWKNKYGH